MTQSYPGPGILQPQKVSSQSTNASSNEQNANTIDEEFLAELEKNLGLVEANANLMPPTPAPSTTPTISNARQQPPSTGTISKTNVPALLPPPQTSGRSSSRGSRGQYSSPRASTVEPNPAVTNS